MYRGLLSIVNCTVSISEDIPYDIMVNFLILFYREYHGEYTMLFYGGFTISNIPGPYRFQRSQILISDHYLSQSDLSPRHPQV